MRIDSTERTLYALWTLFWALMVFVAIEDAGAEHRWWEPCLWEGTSCAVATVWLAIERRAAARWRGDLTRPAVWFGRHLIWFPLLVFTFVTSVFALRHGVYALAGLVYSHRSWPELFLYEGVKQLLYGALWLSIIFGLESFEQWKRERERLLTLQKHLAESQLAQLRAQLQPHFLFNALNTISSLMQVDVERADRLLARVADLLRASLQAGSRTTTTLGEELRLLKLYADIMCERFAGRVTLTWDVEDSALDASVPTFLLQPLLENAFRHGVEPCGGTVAIRVEARRRAEWLDVCLRNSGALTDTTHPGIGIANCRERLRVLYEGRARLDLAQETQDVTVRLTIPASLIA